MERKGKVLTGNQTPAIHLIHPFTELSQLKYFQRSKDKRNERLCNFETDSS
jgi:hypothetical protein